MKSPPVGVPRPTDQPKSPGLSKKSVIFAACKETEREFSKSCLLLRLVQETFFQCVNGQGQGA